MLRSLVRCRKQEYFLTWPHSHSHGCCYHRWYFLLQSKKLHSHMFSRDKLSSPGREMRKNEWQFHCCYPIEILQLRISEESHIVLLKTPEAKALFSIWSNCHTSCKVVFFFPFPPTDVHKACQSLLYKISKALSVLITWKIDVVPGENFRIVIVANACFLLLKSLVGRTDELMAFFSSTDSCCSP